MTIFDPVKFTKKLCDLYEVDARRVIDIEISTKDGQVVALVTMLPPPEKDEPDAEGGNPASA